MGPAEAGMSVSRTRSIMRRQTSQYSFLKTFILVQSIYKIVDNNLLARQSVKNGNNMNFLCAGQHPLPRALVLYCRLYSDAQFIGGPQNEVWIAQELAREQDEVRLAFSHQVIRLLRRGDHSYGAHDDIRMRLLDRLREWNLRGKRERMLSCYRVTDLRLLIPGIPA